MALKIIGKGANGTVYDLGGNWVLKITGDKSEYIASKRVAGEDIPGVWKVRAAFKAGKKYVILGKKAKKNSGRAVRVYEALTEYIPNEVVPGLIDPTAVTPEIVRKIKDRDVKELALGLLALKKRGVLYYDLNPENIMFYEGKPVIVDLGTADID